jgi:hypothetical protein
VPGEEIYHGHFYSLEDGSDLKMPWDLSSMFHLPVLGEAYLQTGEARYAEEVLGQLREWHQSNPYRRGVNWTCAMVAGIRLANMVYACHLVEQHPEQSEFMADMGIVSVVQHMKCILAFLEINPSGARNNHYLNSLVGLGFGAVELAGSEEGRAVLEFVAQQLSGELLLEFSADATNSDRPGPTTRSSSIGWSSRRSSLAICSPCRNGPRHNSIRGRWTTRRLRSSEAILVIRRPAGRSFARSTPIWNTVRWRFAKQRLRWPPRRKGPSSAVVCTWLPKSRPSSSLLGAIS